MFESNVSKIFIIDDLGSDVAALRQSKLQLTSVRTLPAQSPAALSLKGKKKKKKRKKLNQSTGFRVSGTRDKKP